MKDKKKKYKSVRITEEMHARLLDSLAIGRAEHGQKLGLLKWIEHVLERGLIEIELK